jgi:hypothetical protein
MKLKMILMSALPALLLAGCNMLPQDNDAKAATVAAATGPVVVELFQSQGCSSCPPANAALNELADRKDVIALSFAVTYWDRLGWKDIFADPAYTQRQRDYASALGNDGVYTPQIVLNGKRAIVGNGKGELARAVRETKALGDGPAIALEDGKVSIGGGSGSGTVWLVRYDPRTQNVAIRTGENGGRTLPHRNIVRELKNLGSWSGNAKSYALPKASDTGYRSAILVQNGKAGPIIAAAKI